MFRTLQNISSPLPSLKEEAVILSPYFSKLQKMVEDAEIEEPDFALLYFLIYFHIRLGEKFVEKKKSGDYLIPCKEKGLTVTNLFNIFPYLQRVVEKSGISCDENFLKASSFSILNCVGFKRIKSPVIKTLLSWQRGTTTLKLYFNVPTPQTVLALHCNRIRPLTAITCPIKLGDLIIGKEDAFHFFIHDLIHADRFFGRAEFLDGQIGFYRLMKQVIQKNIFTCMKEDEIFSKKLDYLISDMNTHVGHQFLYFKAIIIEHYLRKNGVNSQKKMNSFIESDFNSYFTSLLREWQLPEHLVPVALNANSPTFDNNRDLPSLVAFFELQGRYLPI